MICCDITTLLFRHYEDKIGRLEDHAHHEMEEVMNRARSSVEESKALSEKLLSVTKEKNKTESKLNQVTGKLGKLSHDLSEEKQMNECLRKNQDEWQKKLERVEEKLSSACTEKDKEIAELKEELRDLRFFLEAQSQIAQSSMKEEIQGGNVSVGEAAASGGLSAKGQKGGKKRKGRGT